MNNNNKKTICIQCNVVKLVLIFSYLNNKLFYRPLIKIMIYLTEKRVLFVVNIAEHFYQKICYSRYLKITLIKLKT